MGTVPLVKSSPPAGLLIETIGALRARAETSEDERAGDQIDPRHAGRFGHVRREEGRLAMPSCVRRGRLA